MGPDDPADRLEPAPTSSELIARADLHGARAATAGEILSTPTIACEDLSEIAGTRCELKAECLQRTGSFKLRGALNKVSALGPDAAAGLVTASAGNHARALAQAARIRGVGCEVFMPLDASVSKVAAVERLGATVHLEGGSVDEALALARSSAAATGAALVHPFDDIDVIAGQGTIGLELLEQAPEMTRVLVPLGGGGLASGIGIALRRAGAAVSLIGVQAEACAPYVSAIAGEPLDESRMAAGATIADGIAIKRPGVLTLALLADLLDGVLTVTEDEIADAMVFLSDRAKLVSEGAGAVGVAALLSGRLDPLDGSTVAIVSGGNVDSGLLASLLRRRETEEGRRVRLFTRVPDQPGGMAGLLGVVAEARANLVAIEHVREAIPLHVRETGVELTLETRGRSHTDSLVAKLESAGYAVTLE